MELDFEEITSKMEQIVQEIKAYQDMNEATNKVRRYILNLGH